MSQIDNRYIRTRLKLLRHQLGKPTITIQAERMKISRITLNNFLNGKDVSQETLKKIDAYIREYSRD